MAIMIPVSVGEFYDKLTILDIKIENITDLKKKQTAIKEYELLIDISDNIEWNLSFFNELRDINEHLWELEDDIRKCEKKGDFSQVFIDVARNIYKYNDMRSQLKLRINKFYSSDIEEVKSYAV